MNYRLDCFKKYRIDDVYISKYDKFAIATREKAILWYEGLKNDYDEIYLMRFVIEDANGKDIYTVDKKLK